MVIFKTKYGWRKLIMLEAEVCNCWNEWINRLSPFCAIQTRIFLEHSAENYETCLVVTFCSDSCALELTQLRDCEMLLSTAACHINLDTFMIANNYTFLDYIYMKNAFNTEFYIPFFLLFSIHNFCWIFDWLRFAMCLLEKLRSNCDISCFEPYKHIIILLKDLLSCYCSS